MRTIPKTIKMAPCLALLVLVACQTHEGRRGTASHVASEALYFTGDYCPVLVFVPSAFQDARLHGYVAEIALPARSATTNRIAVNVYGEVVFPGTVSLLEGCTVLQAISCAGGFTPFAFSRRLRLQRSSGQTLVLQLRWTRDQSSGRQRVCYGGAADCVLQPGDTIWVGRTMG
jgi:hypothetical protein